MADANLITFVVQHWAEIVQAVASIIGGFAIISKLTPTQTDDKVVNYLLQIVHLGALGLKTEDPNAGKTTPDVTK